MGRRLSFLACDGLDALGSGHRLDDGDGLDADGDDAAQEVDDVLFVVGEAIGVEFLADGGVAGFALFVVVEDPIDGGAVAEDVLPGGGRDVLQGCPAVQDDDARRLRRI